MNFASRRLSWIMIGLCVVLAVGLGAWSLLGEREKSYKADRVLRVGLEDYYPPFAMKDAAGNHTGFDYDIANALCVAIKAECEFVIKPFNEALGMMMNGELDIMVSGLAALDDRKAKISFTAPYYRSRTVYVGKQGISISEDGLRGKRVGAQNASMQLAYLQKRWANIATVVPGQYEDVTAMLLAGEVDVVLVDGLAGYGFLKTEQAVGFDLLGEPLEVDNVLSMACIGVRKDDAALTKALDDAIVSLRLTGEYDRITRKYFSFSIY